MIWEAYKLKDDPSKMLRIVKDDVGWYYIANMPTSRDNIFLK